MIIGLSFFQTPTLKRPDWLSCLQCCVAGVPAAANISATASVPGGVSVLNVASAVAIDSSATSLISVFGVA
jgi:hypothetical protein